MELQAPDIVKWICDKEDKNITRQDTITFLDDYLKFEQLKQNHTEVFQYLVKKSLIHFPCSQGVLSSFGDYERC